MPVSCPYCGYTVPLVITHHLRGCAVRIQQEIDNAQSRERNYQETRQRRLMQRNEQLKTQIAAQEHKHSELSQKLNTLQQTVTQIASIQTTQLEQTTMIQQHQTIQLQEISIQQAKKNMIKADFDRLSKKIYEFYEDMLGIKDIHAEYLAWLKTVKNTDSCFRLLFEAQDDHDPDVYTFMLGEYKKLDNAFEILGLPSVSYHHFHLNEKLTPKSFLWKF